MGNIYKEIIKGNFNLKLIHEEIDIQDTPILFLKIIKSIDKNHTRTHKDIHVYIVFHTLKK